MHQTRRKVEELLKQAGVSLDDAEAKQDNTLDAEVEAQILEIDIVSLLRLLEQLKSRNALIEAKYIQQAGQAGDQISSK